MKTSIVLEKLSPANDVARVLEVFRDIGGVLGGCQGYWGYILAKLGVFKGKGWLKGLMAGVLSFFG